MEIVGLVKVGASVAGVYGRESGRRLFLGATTSMYILFSVTEPVIEDACPCCHFIGLLVKN